MLDIVSYFDANESDVHGQPSYDHAQRSWEEDSGDTSIPVLSNLKQPPARAGPRSVRACPLTPGVMNQEGTGPPVPISTQHCADCDLALQRLADAHRVHHDAPRPRPCKPRFDGPWPMSSTSPGGLPQQEGEGRCRGHYDGFD